MKTILMWKLTFKSNSEAEFFADMYEDYVEGLFSLSLYCNVLFIETEEDKYRPLFKCLGDLNKHFKNIKVELKDTICKEEQWWSQR